MLTTSPYHYLNLRRNPFGELTPEERAELAIVDPGEWIEFLGSERSALQFVGPCGHGKTTHLLAIRRAMPLAEYVYLPEDGPRPTVADHRPAMIDEAQRLTWWQWRRVLRRGGPLILGTHIDFSRKLVRAGLDVRTIAVSVQSSIPRLLQILNRRIHASRLTDTSIPSITEAEAVRLQHAFGADIRAIEHYLYDQFQRCASEQSAWPPAS